MFSICLNYHDNSFLQYKRTHVRSMQAVKKDIVFCPKEKGRALEIDGRLFTRWVSNRGPLSVEPGARSNPPTKKTNRLHQDSN